MADEVLPSHNVSTHLHQSLANEIKIGSRVWIPDDNEVWKIVTVTSVQGEGVSSTFTVDATPTSAKAPKSYSHAQLVMVDPSHLEDMDNMCLMNNMHEAPLLDLLRRRFLERKIYTYTSDILISLNPFEVIPNLYDNPTRYYSIDDSATNFYGEDEAAPLSPHVYQIANNALRALCDGRQGGDFSDQSVIISGESGAGKTENSKYVLGYLIEANNILSSSTANTEESSFAEYLKEVLIQSSVVLEAFGNAKTLRNDNSSRFGKYIKLLYEKEVSSVDQRPYPRLVSAMTETFLLEKSRLTSVGKGERCYHIFYQLVSALDNEELRVQLGLQHDVAAFRMLSQGECFDNSDDKLEFVITMDALKKLQFGGDDLSGILRLLATCLHLGNLDYQADTEKNDMVQISCSTLSVDQLAQNLGLDAGLLRTALITQKLVVRGRSSLKIKILSVDEVANNANALLKWMYSKLFDWIVTKINECHSSRYHSDGRNHFIGILDIFGFEILRTNSFEQLCINYTNERLQQQFNQHVFVSEQDMYQIEGLAWQSVSFQDNQTVIDLISNNKKPLGLLQLLEEQGLLNRKPDDNALLFSFNHQHEVKDVKAKASAIYWKSKFGNNAFVVKHFAGEVTYIVDGFLTKNNDALQEDLMNTLKLSHDGFLRQVMGLSPLAPEVVEGDTEETDEAVDDEATELTNPDSATATATAAAAAATEATANDATASGKKMASAATVSLHFRTQLDALMNTLYSTSPHYIKCVKSNNKKKPIEFEAPLVNQQLRYSGVLEVVRIRREGFPVRMTYKEFFVKYRILLKGEWPTLYFVDPETLSNFDCKPYCTQIVDVAMTHNEVQIGKSMVFLRDQGRDAMQRAIHRYLERKALVIQSKYKSILVRRRYLQQLIKIHVLKRFLKMSVPRKRYLMHLHAIRAIQRFYFYRIRRKRLILELRLRLAATRIQSNFRRSLVQHRFQYIRRKLIAIQSLYRTYRQRKSFVLRKLAAVYIQMYLRRFVYRRRYVKMVRAARRVQQVFRRHVAYARYQRQRWSLLLIQRRLRGFIRRLRYRQTLRRVVLVQSIVRRFLARFVFVRAKACVTMIQTHVRKHLAHKRFMIMKGTTIGLQTWYRCYTQRRRYGRMKRRVVLVAALIRRFLARLRYRRQVRSLIRLQRAVVAFLRNLRLRRRLTALHNVTEISPEKMRSFLATSPADASHLHKCTEPGQPKPVLRRLLHSVLLAPSAISSTANVGGGNRTSVSGETIANTTNNGSNNTPLAMVVKDVLHTTYKDLVDVDSLGRTAFHYLALNPSFGTIDILCSILNTYEFESSGAMEGLDEDEADTMDNARITRIKNDVAESISNTKLLEGWLKKKRGGFMWQRRWVVLSEDYIVYYNSNTVSAKDPKFAIPLEGCTVQRLPGSREPVFEVFAPNMGIKRTFFGSSSKKSMTFMCESEEDLQRWLIPLRAMAGVDTLRSTNVSYVKWELRQTVLSQVDKAGNTPLHTLVMTSSRGSSSSSSGSDETVKVLAWLIENGCNVSSQNLDGNTPLHLALLHHTEPLIVKCLLLKGADTKTVRNKQGQSVLELYRSDASYRDTYGDYFGDYAGSKPAELPFKMKGYSYFSVYLGKQTFEKAQASMSDHPVLTISPLNSKRQLIESSRDIKDAVIAHNTTDDSKSVYWGAMWHMSIPLENLQDESFLLIEYKLKADGPTISSAQISLDRQSVDSQRLVAQLAVPSDGGRQANPILAMKENSKLEVEILLTKKPRNVSIHQLST